MNQMTELKCVFGFQFINRALMRIEFLFSHKHNKYQKDGLRNTNQKKNL